MAKQTITIYDVAREAGVSMATVSRVVNGNTNVKPTTREKVLEVIERLDYRPNAVARGLASKRTRSVGVLIPDITNVYFSTLAQGINDIATMFKYNIILSSFDEHVGTEAVSSVLSRQVDGIIYIGNTLTDTVRRELSHSRIPVVLTDMIDAKEEFPSVNISLEGAFYEATQSLIASGKKKIAFVSTASFIGTEGDDRYRGFSKAIDENQNITKTQLVIDKLSYETGYRLLDKIINEEIDAIISIDDDVAVGIVNALVDNGHNVPDEVSVISANNSKMVTMARPQISSIMPPVYDIGAVSMRLLTKLMDNDSEVDPIITLPYKIAYRETTKN